MDRAYRIGQKREVDVYRLIGAGTCVKQARRSDWDWADLECIDRLEELIYNRQQYKRAIASLACEFPERS